MSSVINRIEINLELVTFLNIIDTWVYPSVIRKTDQFRARGDAFINVNNHNQK